MIKNLNLVNVAGNLTRDPEMRFTPQGKAVCQFSIAVTESYEKDGEKKETTTFIDCTAWEAMAEKCGTMKKGSAVIVVGKLRTDSWEDKQTKQKRYKTYVLAEAVTNPFGGAKKKEVPAPASATAPPAPVDDDIPFALMPPWLPFAAAATISLIA